MTDLSPIETFWREARMTDAALPMALPGAWAFGATRTQADELLALVLRGIKTGTASSLWDYEAAGDALPAVGDLSVLLDGDAAPRAVIETTEVHVVAFGEVSAAHAFAEGEGDRTLAHWRAVHERFWRDHSESPRGFEPDMPVVCELFRLRFAR